MNKVSTKNAVQKSAQGFKLIFKAIVAVVRYVYWEKKFNKLNLSNNKAKREEAAYKYRVSSLSRDLAVADLKSF